MTNGLALLDSVLWMDPSRTLVTGGRDYTSVHAIHYILGRIWCRWYAMNNAQVTTHMAIIHGAHWEGLDAIAADWARCQARVSEEPWPADWKRYGRSAGPRRNTEMVLGSDWTLALVFPGGRGTDDCAGKIVATGRQLIDFRTALAN